MVFQMVHLFLQYLLRSTATSTIPSTPIIPANGLPSRHHSYPRFSNRSTVSYTPSRSTKINIVKTSSADFTPTVTLTIPVQHLL